MKSYYREISSGSPEEDDMEPIIFLHGLGLSGNSFKNVVPTICWETQRKAYILDARNHGKSPRSDRMNYDLLVVDLLEFMEEQNIKKAVLVGSSMGGRTALYFALKFPHRVEALVVEDMTPQNVKSSGGSLVGKLLSKLDELTKKMPPDVDVKELRLTLAKGALDVFGPRFSDRRQFLKTVDISAFAFVKDGNGYKLQCNVEALNRMLAEDALLQGLPHRKLVYGGDALFLYCNKPFFDLGKDPSIRKLFPKAFVKKVESTFHYIHLESPQHFARLVSNFILTRNVPESKI